MERSIRKTLMIATMCVASVALAQGKGGGGGGGGGGPPNGGEETTNNLSYPAVLAGAATVIPGGTWSLAATFPNGMSYGCEGLEGDYPNISCVDDSASVVTPLTAAACTAEGGKCYGKTLYRIYWQKNAANTWQATSGASGANIPLNVHFVDWGDNLESRSWPVGVIRVETNTFQTLEVTDPLNPPTNYRYEMWHVFGQGTNELWGVRATNEATPLPYVYPAWPYAVNRTTTAKLNISKLHKGSAPCPAPLPSTFVPAFVNGEWVSDDPSYVITTLYNAAYTPELNIKGSYVYGYNWNLRADVVAPDVNKAGWWRLTFYTTDNSVDFSTWVDPVTAGVNTLAPPASTLTAAPITALVEAEEEGEGPLYTPVVDAINNVTYIDVCILATKGGGGKKK